MKNIKIVIVKMALVMGMAASIQAAPNFEFYNKSNEMVYITVGDSYAGKNVDKGKTYQQTVNANSPIKVVITSSLPTQEFQISPAGKTAFVSWNPDKSPALYPQTGPLMGLMGKHNPLFGKTQSGLPLTNNISSSQIKQIR